MAKAAAGRNVDFEPIDRLEEKMKRRVGVVEGSLYVQEVEDVPAVR